MKCVTTGASRAYVRVCHKHRIGYHLCIKPRHPARHRTCLPRNSGERRYVCNSFAPVCLTACAIRAWGVPAFAGLEASLAAAADLCAADMSNATEAGLAMRLQALVDGQVFSCSRTALQLPHLQHDATTILHLHRQT